MMVCCKVTLLLVLATCKNAAASKEKEIADGDERAVFLPLATLFPKHCDDNFILFLFISYFFFFFNLASTVA